MTGELQQHPMGSRPAMASIQAVAAGRQPWHAHLSALSRPAVLPEQPPPRAHAARALTGTSSLSSELTSGPIKLRSWRKTRLACRGEAGVVGGGGECGSEQWDVRAVEGVPDEYNIVAVGCDMYLSVPVEGPEVDLWHVDDGSGRQRWKFHQVGDDEYAIRVVGGKGDTRVFLGTDDSGDKIKLYASEDNEKARWTLKPDSEQTPTTSTPTTSSTSTTTHLPPTFVPRLVSLTKMSDTQLDTVLQLISLPENGTPKWWQQYNYIEFLGDGRGFTATLYGACSGTGDLAMIFEELAKISPRSKACDELVAYLPALKKKRGDDIKGIEGIKKIIKGLSDDPAWQRAVWEVYVKLYWQFAMDWSDKKGVSFKRPGPVLTLPLTRGFMVDTSINHGADYDSIMQIVKRMPSAAQTSKDELTWFRAFADAREKMLRSGYEDLDTSKTGDRCKLWKALASEGNTGLVRPFKAYKGYWGDYTI